MLLVFRSSQLRFEFPINVDVAMPSTSLISDCRYRLLMSLVFFASISMPRKNPIRNIAIVISRASQKTCFLLFSILPGVVSAYVF